VPHGDSGADGGVGLGFTELEGDLKFLVEAFGDTGRIPYRLDIFCNDDEFVAAEPTDGVAGSADGSNAIGDGHQQFVADEVTETVVDGLEAIDVEEEYRERIVLHPRCSGEGVTEAIQEHCPAGQAGERINQQIGLGLLEGDVVVSDVRMTTHKSVGFAPAVTNRFAAHRKMAQAAIVCNQPVALLQRLQFTPCHRLEELPYPIAILLVYILQPGADTRLSGGLGTDQILPLRRQGELAGAEVGVPESVLLAATGDQQPFVALVKLGVGLLQLQELCRDVFVNPNSCLDRGRFERFRQYVAHSAVQNRRDLRTGVGVDHGEDLAGGRKPTITPDSLHKLGCQTIRQAPIDECQMRIEVNIVDVIELGLIIGCDHVASDLEHGIEE